MEPEYLPLVSDYYRVSFFYPSFISFRWTKSLSINLSHLNWDLMLCLMKKLESVKSDLVIFLFYFSSVVGENRCSAAAAVVCPVCQTHLCMEHAIPTAYENIFACSVAHKIMNAEELHGTKISLVSFLLEFGLPEGTKLLPEPVLPPPSTMRSSSSDAAAAAPHAGPTTSSSSSSSSSGSSSSNAVASGIAEGSQLPAEEETVDIAGGSV